MILSRIATTKKCARNLLIDTKFFTRESMDTNTTFELQCLEEFVHLGKARQQILRQFGKAFDKTTSLGLFLRMKDSQY